MPFRWTVDPSRRLVVTVAEGTVTDDEVLRFQRELASDPAFEATFDHLVDLTAVERVDVSFDLRVRVAERSIFAGPSRRGIVAKSPHQVGFARQHVLMRAGRPPSDSVAVFTSREEAEAWLAGR